MSDEFTSGMERLEERVYLEYTLDDPVRGEVEIQADVQLKEILDSDDTLVFFQGAAGWDGIEYDRDRGEFYQVNVGRNGYVSKTKRTKDEVQELIQNHIDGGYPGGPRRFVRGAEPL